MNLTSVDWLIMLLYFVFVLGIGFALKRYMKTSKDFFQAGRALARVDLRLGLYQRQPGRAGSHRHGRFRRQIRPGDRALLLASARFRP